MFSSSLASINLITGSKTESFGVKKDAGLSALPSSRWAQGWLLSGGWVQGGVRAFLEPERSSGAAVEGGMAPYAGK